MWDSFLGSVALTDTEPLVWHQICYYYYLSLLEWQQSPSNVGRSVYGIFVRNCFCYSFLIHWGFTLHQQYCSYSLLSQEDWGPWHRWGKHMPPPDQIPTLDMWKIQLVPSQISPNWVWIPIRVSCIEPNEHACSNNDGINQLSRHSYFCQKYLSHYCFYHFCKNIARPNGICMSCCWKGSAGTIKMSWEYEHVGRPLSDQ